MTEFPKMTSVNPVHPENALLPIVLTELGIIRLVNPLHPSNELLPIELTELGIMTLSIFEPLTKSAYVREQGQI